MLALYQDRHLSVREDEAFEKALAAIGWQPGRDGELDIAEAFSRVRKANTDPVLAAELVRDRATLLRTEGDQSTAFECLGKVLAADGIDPAENRFLEQIRGLLFD